MRYSLLALLLFTSFMAMGQSTMHVGGSPGISFVSVSGDDNLEQSGIGNGIFARGTLSFDVHKDWVEGGIGIEVGKMSGRVSVTDTLMIHGVARTYMRDTWEEFASPFGNAYVLLNAKWNIAEGKYMYGGPVWGMMMANSGLLYKVTVINWYAGLSGGIVFPIDNITGLDLGISWRSIKHKGKGYDPGNELQPGLPEHIIESVRLNYLTLSVGIVVHFE